MFQQYPSSALGVMTGSMPKARNAPCADLKCQGEEMVQLDTPVQYSVCPGLSPRVPASVVILRVLVFFLCMGCVLHFWCCGGVVRVGRYWFAPEI